MTRPTTSTTPDPAAALWADGELFVDEPLPDELALLLGVELGLSPVTHVRPGRWLEAHVRVLGAAAGLLGFDGFDASALRGRLASLPAGTSLVSLVPTPASHRALPPGTAWTLEVEPFEGGPVDVEQRGGRDASTAGLRVATGSFRRNQTSAATNLLLRDDTELRAGAVRAAGVDATLWLDLDDHVASIDQHCVVARIDGRLVTPGLDHGALRTAPRHVLVTGDGGASREVVVEASLTPSDLAAAEAVVCLTPWGAVLPVAELDGRVQALSASRALADTIDALLGSPLDEVRR